MGRPKLPASEKATDQIRMRLTAARKQAYRRVAKAAGMKLSAWAIEQCDRGVSLSNTDSQIVITGKGYRTEPPLMVLRFSNSNVASFPDVTKEQYEALCAAPDINAYFRQHFAK